MVWPKLLCQHLNWFLVVSCGFFHSGPCASCNNPKNKCNLIWKQVKRVQIEAQKHKIILSTITMYFTNHTTFPTFSSQDHACFCHTHFITHFQSFFFFHLSNLTNWGWLKRIESHFIWEKRIWWTVRSNPTLLHSQVHNKSQVEQFIQSIQRCLFNLYDKSAHRPPLGNT